MDSGHGFYAGHLSRPHFWPSYRPCCPAQVTFPQRSSVIPSRPSSTSLAGQLSGGSISLSSSNSGATTVRERGVCGQSIACKKVVALGRKRSHRPAQRCSRRCSCWPRRFGPAAGHCKRRQVRTHRQRKDCLRWPLGEGHARLPCLLPLFSPASLLGQYLQVPLQALRPLVGAEGESLDLGEAGGRRKLASE